MNNGAFVEQVEVHWMSKKTTNLFEYCLSNGKDNLLTQWHPRKNAPLTPQETSAGSHKKVWWVCERGHEWEAQIRSRTNGYGCPFCAKKLVVGGENDLTVTHPEVAAQWNYERNAPLVPSGVLAGSHKKVWWHCGKGHEWQATVGSRTCRETGCPVCAGKVVSVGENDLTSAFPEIAEEWNRVKNGNLTPEKVTAFSNKRVWWTCPLGHDYQAAVGARTNSKSGCPFCSGVKVLRGFNDLTTIYPMIAAQWHSRLNGLLTPEEVTHGSNKKVWWVCNNGHVWKAAISSRTGSRKHGCPVCAGNVRQRLD